MTKASLLFLLFLSCFQIDGIEKGLFKRYQMEGNLWYKFINVQAEYETENLIECGSVCLSEYHGTCEMYALQPPKCYLGIFENTESYLSEQDGLSPVYVDLAKLLAALKRTYTEITEVTDATHWDNYIYAIQEFDATQNLLDCSFHCNVIGKEDGCQLFVFHESKCYLGRVDFGEGPLEEVTFPLNVTMYSNTDAVATMTSTFGEKPDVISNRWSKHVEEARTGVSSSACDALTFLESWHYSAHDVETDTCFLANINTESSIEVSLEAGLKVEANLNELNTFRDETFAKKESNIQGSFIYQSFDGTKNTQHCSIHCYFDPDDKCDFHYIYGSTCYLGSFTSDSYVGGPNHHLNVYIYKENVKDPNEKLFSTTVEAQRNKWMRHIKESLETVSEAECAAHAALYMHAPIDFYFFEDPNCHLGDLAYVGSEGSETDLTTLRVRQTNTKSHVDSKYNLIFGLPGNIWSRYVIEEMISLDAFTSSENLYKDCAVRCDLHADKCDFFMYRTNNPYDCYLATYASEDDGSIVTSDDEFNSYHKTSDSTSYVDGKFWTWTDNPRNWAKFIYSKTSSNHKNRCAFFCIYDDQCDFYVFWNSHCWFGNMTTTNGHSIVNNHDAQTIYFRTDQSKDNGVVSNEFNEWNGNMNNANALMSNSYWEYNIYATYSDTIEANCARRCITSYKHTCMFYTLLNDRCQLGRYTYDGRQIHGGTTANTVYKYRADYSVTSMIQEFQGSTNGDCWNSGYRYTTNTYQSYYVTSDSWKYYRNSKYCQWRFYAPNAKRVTIDIRDFKSNDIHDSLKIYIGPTTSSYRIAWLYGKDVSDSVVYSNIPSRVVSMYWYANDKDWSKGFKGYITFSS